MRWAHYRSLRRAAREALNKGTGKHGKYAVDGNHIALLDKNGRAMDWILVIMDAGGETVTEIREG